MKLSEKEFIQKCNEKHNYFYDYSLVKYINIKCKIKIICPKHGLFEQLAKSHKRGFGCPICSGFKYNTETFIEKIKSIHNNKYDYSLVEYTGSHNKIKIICPEHGIFEKLAYNHLNGQGCQKCELMDMEKFLLNCNIVHNNKYDYSLINYIHSKSKIKIICPIHGVFEQLPHNHLRGNNCPKCKGFNMTTEDYVLIAKKIHGDKYDYSKSEYIDSRIKIKIICPKHGLFETLPTVHLSGSICLKCFHNKLKSNTLKFIEKSKFIHGDKYDYSLVDYTKNYIRVKIICPKHGKFEQKPNHHLSGNGCPMCNNSKGETKIRQLLDKKNIEYIQNYKFNDCKNITYLPFDFYLPKQNICIEFDGVLHFKPIEHFGGIKTLNYRKQNDEIKTKFCEINNINLIRIKYDENIENKLNEIK